MQSRAACGRGPIPSAHPEPALRAPRRPAGTLQWRADAQQLVLRFGRALPQGGAAVLWLSFTYPLRAGMSGFYRSTYLGPDGRERGLAATQFEANSARLAFPCFDEPALKVRQSGRQAAGLQHRRLGCSAAGPPGALLHTCLPPRPALSPPPDRRRSLGWR